MAQRFTTSPRFDPAIMVESVDSSSSHPPPTDLPESSASSSAVASVSVEEVPALPGLTDPDAPFEPDESVAPLQTANSAADHRWFRVTPETDTERVALRRVFDDAFALVQAELETVKKRRLLVDSPVPTETDTLQLAAPVVISSPTPPTRKAEKKARKHKHRAGKAAHAKLTRTAQWELAQNVAPRGGG
ncbi:hypothetical protein B0H11DRAFT_1933973 [Mycena galericulata]|nr:hypothetical protein B0H11DRAFT_1933973 [Mycena galericulata]